MKRLGCILLALLPLTGLALQVKGTEYLGLRDVADRLGMKTRWVERDKVLAVESQWTRMLFEVHKREAFLNGTKVFLGYPVVESDGRLYISASDYTHQLQPVLTPQVIGNPPRLRHIVLDAGHGGKDPGAQNPELGLREKALTLDLARRLKGVLQSRGYEVSLVREGDTFIELEERARRANGLGADLFISLHFNASAKRTVEGLETYAYTPRLQPSTARTALSDSDRRDYPGNRNDGWNALLAYYVQRSLTGTAGGLDRGVKRARFTVLEGLEMPGILVEGGFVTHATEGRNIGSAGYRDKLAGAIAEAVTVYQKTLDRLSGEEP